MIYGREMWANKEWDLDWEHPLELRIYWNSGWVWYMILNPNLGKNFTRGFIEDKITCDNDDYIYLTCILNLGHLYKTQISLLFSLHKCGTYYSKARSFRLMMGNKNQGVSYLVWEGPNLGSQALIP